MSEQKTPYSPEFQRFRQQVETALVQATADARELAERTGTELVVRERLEPDGDGQRGNEPETGRTRRKSM